MNGCQELTPEISKYFYFSHSSPSYLQYFHLTEEPWEVSPSPKMTGQGRWSTGYQHFKKVLQVFSSHDTKNF